jgi:hypothetical protein
MKKYNREAIYAGLKDYCIFSKEGDFIEITRWGNKEGYDINISTSHDLGKRNIQITYGEFELIKKLIKELDK